jgi:hypothetical protein
LSDENKYEFGHTKDAPDRIRYHDGIYWIKLIERTRDEFHATLKSCYEMFGISIQIVESDSNMIHIQPVENMPQPVKLPESFAIVTMTESNFPCSYTVHLLLGGNSMIVEDDIEW